MLKNVLKGEAKKPSLLVSVNGIKTRAWEGETVGSVLLRVANFSRLSQVKGSPRSPYCQMGVCFECLAIVDGVESIQGCMVPLRDGMRIEYQLGVREIRNDI